MVYRWVRGQLTDAFFIYNKGNDCISRPSVCLLDCEVSKLKHFMTPPNIPAKTCVGFHFLYYVIQIQLSRSARNVLFKYCASSCVHSFFHNMHKV